MTAPLAVIGGATSGLGHASAVALARTGHRLLLWSRSEERLAACAETLLEQRRTGVNVVAADARDPQAAATVAEAAVALGGADVVVLNAGGPSSVDPTATTADEWRDSLQLLTITPIDLATRLLPMMRSRGFGRIIAVGSSGVREPIPNLAYSNAGRAALVAWLKTVSRSVANDGVTVNAVLPGRIATARVASLDEAQAAREGTSTDEVRRRSQATIPTGRYGEPKEFAAMVAFLASRDASYITGQALAVDGGLLRTW